MNLFDIHHLLTIFQKLKKGIKSAAVTFGFAKEELRRKFKKPSADRSNGTEESRSE